MIPLFKSHYSIGKSILTLSSNKDENFSDSIFSIAEEYGLNKIVLVEDSLVGFLEAYTKSKSLGLQLIYGLRVSVSESLSDTDSSHKIIVFARNGEGSKLLNKIYSFAFTEGEGSIPMEELKRLWSDSSLKMAIPFYDSFIFNNIMSFNSCVPEFDFAKPIFFLENNFLPFDSEVFKGVESFCAKNNFSMHKAKSIYYKYREDFDAYQTYRIVCSRSMGGRQKSLQVPNLDHMGSREFCFDSYLDNLEG